MTYASSVLTGGASIVIYSIASASIDLSIIICFSLLPLAFCFIPDVITQKHSRYVTSLSVCFMSNLKIKSFPITSFLARELSTICFFVVKWQLLIAQLWHIWCTYVIGQHSTMWSTSLAIQTKNYLQSLFKLDRKSEIVLYVNPEKYVTVEIGIITTAIVYNFTKNLEGLTFFCFSIQLKVVKAKTA